MGLVKSKNATLPPFSKMYGADGKSFTYVDEKYAYHGMAYKLEKNYASESSRFPILGNGSTYWTKHGDSFIAVSRNGNVFVGKCYHKPNTFGSLPWYSPSFTELDKLI